MWIMIGEHFAEYDDNRGKYIFVPDSNIATFDTIEAANDYIHNSTPKTISDDKIFRDESLLGGYESVHIEAYYPEHLPHNPTLKGKE